LARPLVRRLTVGLCTVAVAVLAALGAATPAHAADEPTAISVEGPGLSAPVTVRAGNQADLFNRLLHQVGWMASRGGDPMKPDPATLGPRFLLTVWAGDKAVQRYELYPQAAGGPKAHRPADQPRGKTGDAWFYISISVPELLHAAGVPLVDPSAADPLIYRDPAGYIPAAGNTDENRLVSIGDLVNAQRRTLALWVGTALLVLLLVLGAARLSHRYSYHRR